MSTVAKPSAPEFMCWQFVQTGMCRHSDAEHDAMAGEVS